MQHGVEALSCPLPHEQLDSNKSIKYCQRHLTALQVHTLPESHGSGTFLESLKVLSCDTIPKHYGAYIHFWNASDLNIFRLAGDNRDS